MERRGHVLFSRYRFYRHISYLLKGLRNGILGRTVDRGDGDGVHYKVHDALHERVGRKQRALQRPLGHHLLLLLSTHSGGLHAAVNVPPFGWGGC